MPDRQDRVEIQIERDLRRRDGQMLAEIIGPEQPLLLRGHRREEHGVWRLRGGAGVGVRELEEDSAAGAVIHRAVVDLVAGQGRVDAEMIVMRRVHHGLSGRHRRPRRAACPARCRTRTCARGSRYEL